MPETLRQAVPERTVALVRGHRINIRDVPSLFSDGPEPEPNWIECQPWLNFEAIGQGLKRLALRALAAPQAGNEEPVRAGEMRR